VGCDPRNIATGINAAGPPRDHHLSGPRLYCCAGPRHAGGSSSWPRCVGWVVGIFAFAYAALKFPRISGRPSWPRKVLTRIVLWWSVFTSLTGAASNFWALIAIRFSLASVKPGVSYISSSISRCFPGRNARELSPRDHDHALGGALAPLLVVPIQARYGWRTSFYLLDFSACSGPSSGTGGYPTHPRRWPSVPGRAPGNRRPSRVSPMRLCPGESLFAA